VPRRDGAEARLFGRDGLVGPEALDRRDTPPGRPRASAVTASRTGAFRVPARRRRTRPLRTPSRS